MLIPFLIKVSFPETVRWMVLEFDPQCGTAQNEDSLQLYIPASYSRNVHPRLPCKAMGQMISQKAPEDCHRRVEQGWWPVLRRFSGVTGWPHLAVVLPGMNLFLFPFKGCLDSPLLSSLMACHRQQSLLLSGDGI